MFKVKIQRFFYLMEWFNVSWKCMDFSWTTWSPILTRFAHKTLLALAYYEGWTFFLPPSGLFTLGWPLRNEGRNIFWGKLCRRRENGNSGVVWLAASREPSELTSASLENREKTKHRSFLIHSDLQTFDCWTTVTILPVPNLFSLSPTHLHTRWCV